MRRERTPSAASIESQSVKRLNRVARMALMAPRRLLGVGRHLLADTEGFVFKVVVHPANLRDLLGAKLVLGALGSAFPRLHHIWADQGYAGALRQWTREHLGIELEVVSPGGASSSGTARISWTTWASNRAFTSCHGGGSLSAGLLGSGAHAVSVVIIRVFPPGATRSSTSPASDCCCTDCCETR